MARTWTLREIARESGRPLSHVTAMARAGLVPGYQPGQPPRPARIPADVAADVVLVLRLGVCSHKFAALMKSDPLTAQKGVRALDRLSERAAALATKEEATAA